MRLTSGARMEVALRARGMRVTSQRQDVLDAVTALGHATPEQVAQRLDDEGRPIALSTVYRTVELLEEIGLVTHTHLHHGSPTYQVAEHVDHVHLVCRRCGSLTQAEPAAVEQLVARLVAETGFVVDPHHVALHGRCATCSAGTSEPPHALSPS